MSKAVYEFPSASYTYAGPGEDIQVVGSVPASEFTHVQLFVNFTAVGASTPSVELIAVDPQTGNAPDTVVDAVPDGANTGSLSPAAGLYLAHGVVLGSEYQARVLLGGSNQNSTFSVTVVLSD